jgi:protein-S-isoprenylcysteine O-methyltransferase Ste14
LHHPVGDGSRLKQITSWFGRVLYRLLRYPIYSAVLGMCGCAALVDQHFHALVGGALVAVAYWRKIRMEEAEGFGAQYDDYRRATWRLVPGLF